MAKENTVPETNAENTSVDAACATNLLDADPEFRRLFNVRKVQKSRKPSFHKQGQHKFKRLSTSWRRPRGNQSKQRAGFYGKGALVTVGYGSPALIKGLHPSGFDEVIVNNVDELSLVDPEFEAVRIAGGVGGKKKAVIVAKAAEFGIKVLNPGKGEV
ncbi:50S ribosomal protein L32e [Methanolapillus millepedarum]|uniref:Large ribosomal subunit protein eL32 n=1 Tax=Methanolapillus millepedarum TaxID=3028296 RepID=A0AA96V4G5_9EURY|nr:hypothetical protein MsAc7_11230 [Methanosarcinaceae archaeon Ac7]